MTPKRLAGSLVIRVYRSGKKLRVAVHELRGGEVKTFGSWDEVIAHLQSLYPTGLR